MARFILIETSPWRASDSVAVAHRLAGGGSRAYNHRGFSDWRGGIATDPLFTSALSFDEKGWGGGAVPTTGAIGFMPADKVFLTSLADDHLWIGAPIEIRSGDDQLAPGVFVLELKGTIAAVRVKDGVITFVVADLAKSLDEPLLKARFAGTGGIEGIAEAEGRIKRRTWGRAFNVEGRVLDKATNVYEFGDLAFPWQAFDLVSDKGRSGPLTVLAWQGSVQATFDALKASAPAAGGAVVAPSIACVKWWTIPSGPLTADVRGEVGTGYVETSAAIAARIVAAAAGPAFDATTYNAIAAARTAVVGVHVDDEGESLAEVLDRLLGGVSVVWTLSSAGVISMFEIKLADPVETIAIVGDVERLDTHRPLKSRRIGYRVNHRRHGDGEISAAILSAEIEDLGDLATVDHVYFGGPYIKEALGGTDATLLNFKTAQGTAAAIASQGAFATVSSAAYGSALLTGFGALAPLGSVYFDSGFIKETSGGANATIAAFKTSAGTAAGIVSQGTGATANNLTGLNAAEGVKLGGVAPGASSDLTLYKQGAGSLSIAGNSAGPGSTGNAAKSLERFSGAFRISWRVKRNGSAIVATSGIAVPGAGAAYNSLAFGIYPGASGATVYVYENGSESSYALAWTDDTVFSFETDGTGRGFYRMDGGTPFRTVTVSTSTVFQFAAAFENTAGQIVDVKVTGRGIQPDINSNVLDGGASFGIVPRSEIRTPLGTAAAIAGQADWATYTGVSAPTMAGRTQNLSTLGRASASFLSALDARAFGKVVFSGEAGNGVAISFGQTFSSVPKVSMLPGGKGPTAGANIAIRADALTASGFTMKATEQSITPGAMITDSTVATNIDGFDFAIDRSSASHPYDGKFTYTFDVNVPSVGGGEPGSLTVKLFARKGGVWTEVGSAMFTSSGTKTVTVYPGTVDFGAGQEFAVDKVEGNGTITGFQNVKYTPGSITESTLTNLSNIPFIAFLEQ